jgi:micrococcal nuclease
MKGAALVALGFTLACGTGTDAQCGPDHAQVSRVIDGDTLELVDGMKVRLLLVDAPETTSGKHECGGEVATHFTTATALGKSVTLTFEQTRCFDRFGRLLAFVTVEGIELNAELVARGLACASLDTSPESQHTEDFATLEAQARNSRTGIWGRCESIPCSRH